LTIIASGVQYILDLLAKKKLELAQKMMLKRLEFETQVATTSILPSISLSSSAPSRIQSFLMTKMKLTKSLSVVCESIAIAIFIIVVNIAVGIFCHKYLFDELPLVDSIYLSVITITTLGYGDIVPRTTSSRGFTLLYAFIGVLSTARAVSLVNDACTLLLAPTPTPTEEEEPLIDEREQREFYDRNEFVLYKLTKMGILTPDLRAHIEQLFSAMDVGQSGILSSHDILKFRELLHRESELHRESLPAQ
jgi:voltage-gated potassium channel Kch